MNQVAAVHSANLDTPANTNAPVSHDQLSAFAKFGLAPEIQRALDAAGYTEPTPIQAGSIPALMQNRDMLGIAQTGTGKTAAFALPFLHKLATTPYQLTPKGTRALILAPTRELVIQIADSFRTYGKFVRMKSCAVFGGVSEIHQIKAMAGGVDVLVATPGRLLDLVNRRHINLSSIQTFVLDEADRMLDMGFIRDINKIVAMIPTERQSLLFSATMPKEIAHLAAKLLRDPVRVEVTPETITVDKVEQKVFFVDANQKRPLLVSLLKDPALTRVVVFTRTKHVANRVSDYIAAAGITSDAIHGNKSQNARQKALESFKKGQVRVLVATDIAARGIHVSDISHVINYELPNIPESYVHRIGRTARAGASGIALSFCDRAERSYLRDIERFARTSLTPTDHPFTGAATRDAGEPDRAERPRNGRGGRDGNRGFGDRSRNDRGKNERGNGGQGKRHNGERAERPHHAERAERQHTERPRPEPRVHHEARAEHPRHEPRVQHESREIHISDDPPATRAAANLSHAERYFGGGRSPHQESQKRPEHKPHGPAKHGARPHGQKPQAPKGEQGGQRPLQRGGKILELRN
ncbi:MAG: DEAD/DEAH box helicase [Rhodospirillaceae bacterium]|nr:DEAD/DEAH box helicase [Rhodospirillaceae bacterium]